MTNNEIVKSALSKYLEMSNAKLLHAEQWSELELQGYTWDSHVASFASAKGVIEGLPSGTYELSCESEKGEEFTMFANIFGSYVEVALDNCQDYEKAHGAWSRHKPNLATAIAMTLTFAGLK